MRTGHASRTRLAVIVTVATLVVASFGIASPVGAVDGLSITNLTGSTADEVAGVLLASGVTLHGSASINGSSVPGDYEDALQSFGTFSDGGAAFGIDQGLVITANSDAASFSSPGWVPESVSVNRGDTDLGAVLVDSGICGSDNCVQNATSLEFELVPEARYLKFEYVLAITEEGEYSGGMWDGEVFYYPDGFALFVGGTAVADNCAVVPGTYGTSAPTYLSMQEAGIVAPTGDLADNRAAAQANLEVWQADPDTVANGVAYATEKHKGDDWTVQFLTVPLTCVFDANVAYQAQDPLSLRIVIGDANDSAIPPAVFLAGNSVRWSDDPTPTPPTTPVPTTPPPTTPAPPAPGPGVTPPPPGGSSTTIRNGQPVTVPVFEPVANQPGTVVAPTPSGQGSWAVTPDGGVFTAGDASFHGSLGGIPLVSPIVGITPTPTGQGYYLVGADGGVFAFGDAQFHGSLGGVALNQPVAAIVSTCTLDGYYLVAQDGGVFSFGDAVFYGSMGGSALNKGMTGIFPFCQGGYWTYADDGGVFTFGDAPFFGSLGSNPPAGGLAGFQAFPNEAGYWLIGRDGSVHAFAKAS